MISLREFKKNRSFLNLVRVASSVLAILGCLFFIVSSAGIGFSQLLARYGVLATSLPATSQGIRLAPSNADAHRAQANVFRHLQMYQEARRELEIATSLRPKDDLLWLELGTVRDELNDFEGALRAFDQAVANAPFYAHTRWQRANLRLRLGRYDEAFTELREAARSNRNFLPTLIDLAWGLSRNDAKLTQQLAGIEAPESRIEFARFLAKRGKGKETLEQFHLLAGQISPEYQRELVRELITNREYEEAFEIWKEAGGGIEKAGSVYDGGFEGPISFNEAGFGWRISQEPNLNVSQDTTEKHSGGKSLRIAFKGDTPTAQPLLSQITIVRPGQKYRINFAVKSQDIISGGQLVLEVVDATGFQTLVSLTLPVYSEPWRTHSIEFTTSLKCNAIVLRVIRQQCLSSPCPIFGTIWLDSFSIDELADYNLALKRSAG